MVSDPPADVCLMQYFFNQCSLSAVVTTAIRSHAFTLPSVKLVTEGSVDTFRLSAIDQKYVVRFLTALFAMISWESSLRPIVFPLGLPSCTNKYACCEHTETIDVLENLFL